MWLAFRHLADDLTDEDVKGGMKLRLAFKARGLDLSFTDAVGYHSARRIHARFVTRDDALKGLPHVEFLG